MQPWTYNREVRLPGQALADRVGEDWKYQDVPTPLGDTYQQLLADAERALGPESMKELRAVLADMEGVNPLGKQ